MGRILGIDYGDVRTGLAVSDETGFLASGIGTVEAGGDAKLIEKIVGTVEQYGDITSVVVGEPVNMDGSRGARSEKAREFARKLGLRTGLPVELYDERRTTLAASVFMNETDTRGKKRKASIDTLSAEIILQNYLDRKRSRSNS